MPISMTVVLPYLLLLLFQSAAHAATAEATIHQEFRYQLPKATLQWTPVAGLPSGLRILPESAEIWGAPNEAGQYSFELQAGDGTRFTLDLKVNALWNLSLTPPQAAVDVGFSHRQVVAGGTPPYAFSATGLPPELTISRDGLISGTPVKAGTYEATITASDHARNTLALPYKLTVNGVGIVTKELPFAEVDKPYAQQLVAAGGRPPYTWSLVDEGTCSGLRQRPVGVTNWEPLRPILTLSNGSLTAAAATLSPSGLLTVRSPREYDSTYCAQVTDSTGNKAQSWLTVVSQRPHGTAVQAYVFTTGEVSVGDPVLCFGSAGNGTPPYEVTAPAMPAGFVFYPEEGFIFGYPQTAGLQTIRIQVKDATGAKAETAGSFQVSPIRVGAASTGLPMYGKAYSQQFYAVNAAPPYTWGALPSQYIEAQIPAGLSFNSSGLLSGTPLEAGLFFPTGRITDAFGNSREFRIIETVSAGTAGIAGLSSGEIPYLTIGHESRYTAQIFTDRYPPYTWTISGALPPGMVAEGDPGGSLTFWGLPTKVGTYPISVRATDAKANVAIRIFQLRVTSLYSEVSDIPDGVVGVPQQVPLHVDGGVAPYRWSLKQGDTLPPGITLSDGGVLSGAPAQGGHYTFELSVSDAASNSTDLRFGWLITEMQISPARPFPESMFRNEPFSLQLRVLGGTPGFTWTLQPPDCAPSGLTLDQDGLFSGSAQQFGSFSCMIVATDARERSARYYVRFQVIDAGLYRPRIAGPVSWLASVGRLFSMPLDVQAVSPYSLFGAGLPPGLAFDGKVIRGYPTKPGDYAFLIQVTDALGQQALTRAYIRVSALHIVPYPSTGAYNKPYSYQFRVIEQQQGTRWSVKPGDRIPVGLKLSASGLLSGIPVETGLFPFTVRANDAEAEVILEIDAGNDYYYWDYRPEPVGDVGQPFDEWLVGGEVTEVRILSGSLPPGLALTPEGKAFGTPTAVGAFTFTIRTEDGRGNFAIAVITIRIGLPFGENRILTAATVGKPYAAQVQGGALAPGESLPPGLTLAPDGTLSGTPTKPWLYQFSVVLDDSPTDSVLSAYTLEVLEKQI